jgi:tetratricopeptide (TPR) repeat protein
LYEKAAESFKRAILLDSNCGEAHLNLGMVYLALNRHQDAREEYSILKKLNSKAAGKLFEAIKNQTAVTIEGD